MARDAMASLGRVITEAIVLEYGRNEFSASRAPVLVPGPRRRHGDGLALVRDHDFGARRAQARARAGPVGARHSRLWGRGRESRKTPAEVTGLCERLGLDGDALVRASRLVAKVDSAAVQDGYDLYLHGFILADEGGGPSSSRE